MDSKSHSRHRSMCLPSPTIHTRLNDHCKLRSGFWRPGPWTPQRRSRTMLVWRPSVGRRPRIPREWKENWATLFTRARLDHLRRTILILSPTIHRWLDLPFTVSECTSLIHMLLSAGKRDLLFWYSNNSIRTFKQLHALWYIRVFGSNPVLENKGIFGVFEYSIPLHPPLWPFLQY